ncbi:ABC transporter ATP-binding protein [Fulvivirga lutimaris]|uniref:ABC transporter ATP-binding protein n=1 Tax=Fulvivirga lutimaris TaxID=1819566 RepID=UPI001627EC50|nr:ABC transporter ATP-binding protein [Fulvivirga lutimaris]
MSFILLDKVSKSYNDDIALGPTSLSIDRNEKLGIVGETGSGKSTLLKTIAGLVAPDVGQIKFKDEVLENPNDQLIPGHPSIAYLSQHFELPFFRTVEEIVYDPYKISENQVNELYKACHIEHLLQADSQQLSGGEKQRVALAKLLVDGPEVLLLDEPFSNLDLHHQKIIKSALETIVKSMDTTIVLVAHNPMDVLSWADRVLTMRQGKVIQGDNPFNTYNFPQNEYVAGLFGEYNLIDASKWGLDDTRLTKVNGKVFVRPEAISICDNDKSAKNAKVLAVTYQGSHDQLLVELDGEEIVIYGNVGAKAIGDKVPVKLQVDKG